MLYKFIMEKDGDGYMVSFPDIPEALTAGADYDEALSNAMDALITAFEFYFEDNRPIPLPSPLSEEDDFIAIPAGITAKILLLNEILASGISQAELGRRLGIKRQNMQRIVDLEHSTKIETIEEAIQALGKQLELRVI